MKSVVWIAALARVASPRLCLVIVALVLALAAPVAAGPLEDGLYAYNRGDYAAAFRLLRPLADQGHAAAQVSLGIIFGIGLGVPQDYAEAERWFRLAAEQGHPRALGSLGVMYDKGLGVPQDYAKAERWYRKAAEQGYALAQYNLGVMYNKGQGVPQDYAEAVKWYHKAAAQGDASAQYNLGYMYHNGLGVPPDYVQAYMWLNLAASALTGEMHDKTVKNRDLTAAKMTPAQIAEAQKLAREWRPK